MGNSFEDFLNDFAGSMAKEVERDSLIDTTPLTDDGYDDGMIPATFENWGCSEKGIIFTAGNQGDNLLDRVAFIYDAPERLDALIDRLIAARETAFGPR